MHIREKGTSIRYEFNPVFQKCEKSVEIAQLEDVGLWF